MIGQIDAPATAPTRAGDLDFYKAIGFVDEAELPRG